MAGIVHVMKNYSSFLQNHQLSVTNALLILCTTAGEQIFKASGVFKCPCSQPEAENYTALYLIVPAAVLFITGFMINSLTWHFCHGCYKRKTKEEEQTDNSDQPKDKAEKHRDKTNQPEDIPRKTKEETPCIDAGMCFCSVFLRACIVPLVWFFITFLDGSYYVCMVSKDPCSSDSEENIRLKMISQNGSWIALIVAIIAFTVVICLVRCFDTTTLIQWNYKNIYRETEEEKMIQSFKRVAAENVQIQVEAFLKGEPKKSDWDMISKVPRYKFESEENPPIYTRLNSWFEVKRKGYTPKNDDQDKVKLLKAGENAGEDAIELQEIDQQLTQTSATAPPSATVLTTATDFNEHKK